jgi:hypothetical protein
MIGKDFNVKHKSSQLKGFGSKTCASLGKTIPLNIYINNNRYTPYKDFHKFINVW